MFFVLMCVSLGALAQQKVAVYVGGNIDSYRKDLISSKATSRISRTNGYVVVERNEAFLRALTKEQDYQLSGEVPDEEIIAVGRRYGAKYVAVFIAKGDGEEGFVSGRLINTATGAVKKSAEASRDIESNKDWTALANNVLYRLFVQK